MAFKNITLFGAGGKKSIGYYVLHALLEDGGFNVSVLARDSSKTTYPASVTVNKVPDDLPHNELVAALQGQDVVIFAIGFEAQNIQYKVIDASVEAGIKRFIPSKWGFDNGDPLNQDLSPVFEGKAKIAAYLDSKAKENSNFSWTAVATSIWMEWALNANFIGVDPVNHSATYWDNGTYRFSNTTLAYSAKAALEMLKHPDVGKNQRVFVSGFEASQQDIVAELEKQQGVTYSISHEDGHKVIEQAKRKWVEEKDPAAPYALIQAGILLPEFGAGFVSAGKQPILENLVSLPKLTLEGVVREFVQGELRN